LPDGKIAYIAQPSTELLGFVFVIPYPTAGRVELGWILLAAFTQTIGGFGVVTLMTLDPFQFFTVVARALLANRTLVVPVVAVVRKLLHGFLRSASATDLQGNRGMFVFKRKHRNSKNFL